MQKLVITTITGGLLAASSAVAGDFSTPIAPTAPAVEAAGSLAVGYNSQYMFRGLNLGNDQVTAQVDYATNVLGQAIDLSAAYLSTQGTSQDELRLTASTSRDLGFVTGHLGYQFRDYAGGTNHNEVFFGISKEVFGVATSLTHFWAIDTSDNQGYTELGLAKSVNVYDHNINLGATVGYLVEEGGFSHATLKASYDIAVGQATLSPYIAYTVELDELEQYAGTTESNEFFFGASLSVNF